MEIFFEYGTVERLNKPSEGVLHVRTDGAPSYQSNFYCALAIDLIAVATSVAGIRSIV